MDSFLKKYTHHEFSCVVNRGNAAIKAAIENIPSGKTIIIPQEGGWISYEKIAKNLTVKKLKCNQSKLDINHLKELLKDFPFALLYNQPGGYTVPQDSKEIYNLCKEHNCLVIMDVSGSIGTRLCNGDYADICIGSFRKWKLVNAGVGGFISTNNKDYLKFAKPLENQEDLKIILHNLKILPERIDYLLQIKQQIIEDLKENYFILGKDDSTPGIIIPYKEEKEKENIINYCNSKQLEWTQCPREIRINEKAISIEVKRK